MSLESSAPEFVCPQCRAPIRAAGARWECTGCSKTYDGAQAIPVFYPERAGSSETLKRVLAAGPQATWLELLPLLHPKGNVPADPAQAQRWADQRILRHDRFYQMFRRRSSEVWPHGGRRLACEIGCGRGDGLPALARDFDHVVGVDVNLPSLVGAARLVSERRLSNVTLVQASAHELPFAAGVFDYVQAINVIEHVFRPEHFFAEIKRVLAPNGIFCGDSRNRFDAFFPEPHVQLMWVGFLPRQLMGSYVRLRKRRGYGGVHLLSYFELQRALTRNFGAECRIALPDVRTYLPNVPASAARLVESLHASPRVERLALPVFPTHLALARG